MGWVVEVTHDSGKVEEFKAVNEQAAQEKAAEYAKTLPEAQRERKGAAVNVDGVYSVILHPPADY